MLRVSVLLAVLPLLAGCQTAPRPISPDLMAAACMSHAYLHANGFLSTVPEGKVVLLNTDLHYEQEGVLDYPRLLKDRHNSFRRKLRGVWIADGYTKYRVKYGPVERLQQCVGVTEDFTFAYMLKACDTAGTFIELREHELSC
ncbi:MAG: hypothetical protein AB7I36_04055 [Rhodospirillaceae bacterium]